VQEENPQQTTGPHRLDQQGKATMLQESNYAATLLVDA